VPLHTQPHGHNSDREGGRVGTVRASKCRARSAINKTMNRRTQTERGRESHKTGQTSTDAGGQGHSMAQHFEQHQAWLVGKEGGRWLGVVQYSRSRQAQQAPRQLAGATDHGAAAAAGRQQAAWHTGQDMGGQAAMCAVRQRVAKLGDIRREVASQPPGVVVGSLFHCLLSKGRAGL